MEKLIRDKVHLIPHPAYPNMQIRKVVDIIEHISFLIHKIQEEEREFKNAEGIDKIGESTDLLEIYDTLIDLYITTKNKTERERFIHSRETLLETIRNIGISVDEVLRIQEVKRKEKGGFRHGIIWIYE